MYEEIIELAKKGIFVAAAFDKNCIYYKIPSWVYIINDINDDDNFNSYYGYNSYEEAIDEALNIIRTINYEKNI